MQKRGNYDGAQVTRHAGRRARERLGIPKKATQSNADRALRNGIHLEQTSGSLRRYLDYIWYNDTPKNNIRIYHQNIYIFNNDILVTILPLPAKYHKTADKLEHKNTK